MRDSGGETLKPLGQPNEQTGVLSGGGSGASHAVDEKAVVEASATRKHSAPPPLLSGGHHADGLSEELSDSRTPLGIFTGEQPTSPAQKPVEVCSDCEQDPCVCCLDWHHDRRDPAYDPRHAWYCYGEAEDGTRGYRCGRCGKEYLD